MRGRHGVVVWWGAGPLQREAAHPFCPLIPNFSLLLFYNDHAYIDHP